MERLALRHILIDGDVIFVGKDTNKRLQMLEGHRLRSPHTKKNVVHGILMTDARERKEYWFTKEDIEPYRNQPRNDQMVKIPVLDAE